MFLGVVPYIIFIYLGTRAADPVNNSISSTDARCDRVSVRGRGGNKIFADSSGKMLWKQMVFCECIWGKKTFIILMSFLDYENNNIIKTDNDLVRSEPIAKQNLQWEILNFIFGVGKIRNLKKLCWKIFQS